MPRRGTQQRLFGREHVVDRFHLGNHEVAEPVSGVARDRGHIICKSGVIDRVYARCDTGLRRSVARELCYKSGVGGFGPHGGAIFAIERDIENAGAKLLRHLGLQLQAFAHACLDAAVMIANRQKTGLRLRVEQHFTRMAANQSLACRQMG